MKWIKILYVEDEKSIIEFVRILLKKRPYLNVTYAQNGKEAFELYKKDLYDIVITDVVMPVMDGFELIETIRKINLKQIFIMVTGLENKEDFIRAIDLKVNFFIAKQIEPKKFNHVLQDCIDLVNQKKELEFSNLLLTQYKYAIDSSTILSKTDKKGNITYVNEKFCKASKYTRDELIGKPHNIVRHSDMPASTFKEMWGTIQSKKMWKGKIKNRAKDGTEYIADVVIVPLLDTNNNIIEYLGIRHDITELELYKNDLQKQLSIAIKDVIDTQKEIVFTMGAIGETRSKETGFHIKRVAEYSYLLASLAGLKEEEAKLLKLASPMHDIGKVGIPDAILHKQDKLTFEEFEIIKTHSLLGYEMLKGSQREILKTSATIAYEHHEKWDGTGYPRGLKEEAIHISGRITAVCDVFDALGSDRCYKKAWQLEKIIEHFKEEKGKHFDPILVDLFLDNIDKFLKIKDMHVD